jgi:hypothetical protein
MLFVTIHKYEPKYLASLLLKLSVLTFGGLAVLHRSAAAVWRRVLVRVEVLGGVSRMEIDSRHAVGLNM